MVYIIVAILIFGVLIATHELGHFLSAKLLGVKVNEFSIGMGPALWQSRKEDSWEEEDKTLYSLRLLPIGGYCAMEGEDDDSADPRAFGRAAWWKKIIILCAGAGMNFLTGLLIMLALYLPAKGIWQESFGGAIEGYHMEDCGLLPGDKILAVDGHRILVSGNTSFYLSRAGDTVDFVVERDGQRLKLDGVYLPRQEGVNEEGRPVLTRGVYLTRKVVDVGPLGKLDYAWRSCVDFVRLVWVSLGDLVTGAVGLRDLSGPVGIVDMMGEVGSQSPTFYDAVWNLSYLAALIAVNLAVMNLLPLPALDGGRVFFLALNGLIYGAFRRKIDPRYEGYVHMAGLALLMLLMLAVTLSDVGKLLEH